MTYNVYYFNINKQKIETYNIFEHGSFIKYVRKHLEDCKTKEEFSEELKSELHYYFWSKAEWEVIITSWVGGNRKKDAVKIDVYSQVMNNFEVFADYVWSNKNKLIKGE